FSILDTSDTYDVIHHLRSKFVANAKGERYPNKKILAKLFSLNKNKQLDLRVLLQRYYPQFLHLESSILDLYDAFDDYKTRHQLLDFDDILYKTWQLFDEYPKKCEAIASRCEHLLVDEYQDTNHIQSLLCEALSSVHQRITVVGDDAQSIYGFRGASSDNIRNFPDAGHPTELIKLEQNYRSTPQILNVANKLLQQS
ncbi:MAG: ATP-dependent helicase, partial [Bacteroidota bacterium]